MTGKVVWLLTEEPDRPTQVVLCLLEEQVGHPDAEIEWMVPVEEPNG